MTAPATSLHPSLRPVLAYDRATRDVYDDPDLSAEGVAVGLAVARLRREQAPVTAEAVAGLSRLPVGVVAPLLDSARAEASTRHRLSLVPGTAR